MGIGLRDENIRLHSEVISNLEKIKEANLKVEDLLDGCNLLNNYLEQLGFAVDSNGNLVKIDELDEDEEDEEDEEENELDDLL